jgi:hypothetical protein
LTKGLKISKNVVTMSEVMTKVASSLPEYPSFELRAYSNGHKHWYGVDETGKLRHLSGDKILTLYGYGKPNGVVPVIKPPTTEEPPTVQEFPVYEDHDGQLTFLRPLPPKPVPRIYDQDKDGVATPLTWPAAPQVTPAEETVVVAEKRRPLKRVLAALGALLLVGFAAYGVKEALDEDGTSQPSITADQSPTVTLPPIPETGEPDTPVITTPVQTEPPISPADTLPGDVTEVPTPPVTEVPPVAPVEPSEPAELGDVSSDASPGPVVEVSPAPDAPVATREIVVAAQVDLNDWSWNVAHQLAPGNETAFMQRGIDAYNQKHGTHFALTPVRDTIMIVDGTHIVNPSEMEEMNQLMLLDY